MHARPSRELREVICLLTHVPARVGHVHPRVLLLLLGLGWKFSLIVADVPASVTRDRVRAGRINLDVALVEQLLLDLDAQLDHGRRGYGDDVVIREDLHVGLDVAAGALVSAVEVHAVPHDRVGIPARGLRLDRLGHHVRGRLRQGHLVEDVHAVAHELAIPEEGPDLREHTEREVVPEIPATPEEAAGVEELRSHDQPADFPLLAIGTDNDPREDIVHGLAGRNLVADLLLAIPRRPVDTLDTGRHEPRLPLRCARIAMGMGAVVDPEMDEPVAFPAPDTAHQRLGVDQLEGYRLGLRIHHVAKANRVKLVLAVGSRRHDHAAAPRHQRSQQFLEVGYERGLVDQGGRPRLGAHLLGGFVAGFVLLGCLRDDVGSRRSVRAIVVNLEAPVGHAREGLLESGRDGQVHAIEARFNVLLGLSQFHAVVRAPIPALG